MFSTGPEDYNLLFNYRRAGTELEGQFLLVVRDEGRHFGVFNVELNTFGSGTLNSILARLGQIARTTSELEVVVDTKSLSVPNELRADT